MRSALRWPSDWPLGSSLDLEAKLGLGLNSFSILKSLSINVKIVYNFLASIVTFTGQAKFWRWTDKRLTDPKKSKLKGKKNLPLITSSISFSMILWSKSEEENDGPPQIHDYLWGYCMRCSSLPKFMWVIQKLSEWQNWPR